MSLRALRLIACAIALVVPLQGMAAVMGGQCMALGHHQDGHAGSHGDGHAEGDAHEQAAHSHGDPVAKDTDDSSPHCGPCAACCASASIAGPAGFLIAASASYARYVFSQFTPAGNSPGALERPPHSL